MVFPIDKERGIVLLEHRKDLFYKEGEAMKRREFLKQGLTVSAGLALGGMPRFVRLAEANETGKWRTFEVITRVEVLDPVGAVRVWVPVPLTSNTDYFKREADKWSGNFKAARAVQYDRYGNGVDVRGVGCWGEVPGLGGS
jgi:hypothetical protein